MIGHRRYRRYVGPSRFALALWWTGRRPWVPILILFLLRLTLEKGL